MVSTLKAEAVLYQKEIMNLSDKIKEAVQIEDLANRCGYPVQRNGFCFSIYKDEKTPSLKVYPGTNTFWDFSSAQGGSVIDFWMGVYNVDFKTAIDDLANVFGIDRDRGGVIRDLPVKKKRTKEENIFECMSKIELELYEERAAIADEQQAFKEVRLYRTQQNKRIFNELWHYCYNIGWNSDAEQYMLKKRNIPARIVFVLKVFFVKDYFRVSNHLKKIFALDELQRSGLYNDNGNLIFCAHRIIIPYLHNGQIVYLRARYFDSDNNSYTDRNKYLGLRNDALGVNTPKRFFNRDVIATMKPGEKLYIVEGEFDAMVLEGLGYNSIAVPGIGNLPDNNEFRRLLKFDIVFCPDGDEAGKNLSDRINEIFWRYSKEIKIKQLPNKDVSDFVEALA